MHPMAKTLMERREEGRGGSRDRIAKGREIDETKERECEILEILGFLDSRDKKQ